MTESIAATPGWVDTRLDEIFATIPNSPAIEAARLRYGDCLAARKAPAAPSDQLGAEFEACRPALRRAMMGESIEFTPEFDKALEALEAEIDADS